MKHIILLTTILMLSSCAQFQTDWNFNQGINFSEYKTYSWVSSESEKKEHKFNPFIHPKVVSYIEDVLESKGLKKSKDNNSDVHVNYMINLSDKIIRNQYYDYYSFGGNTSHRNRSSSAYGYYGNNGPYYSKQMSYEKASFVIDLLDKSTRGIAWRGHASKTIDRSKNYKEQFEIIKSAVDKLFKNYPPEK